MAWEARLGLKHIRRIGKTHLYHRLNGLGSPFGFETPTGIWKCLLEARG